MKRISRKYSFDDELLLPKIPAEMRFLESFETDEPLFVAPNLFDRPLCDTIIQTLRESDPNIKLTERSLQEDGTEIETVNEKVRNVFWFYPNAEIMDLYQRALDRAKPALERFFGVRLKASEGLQTLGYGPGCKYVLHSDTCVVRKDAQGNWDWKVSFPKRVISTILFLSDSVSKIFDVNQCVGGDVSFDYLLDDAGKPLRIRPTKGLFVAFPSTPLFSHQVHEVTDGYRITLVEWYAAERSP